MSETTTQAPHRRRADAEQRSRFTREMLEAFGFKMLPPRRDGFIMPGGEPRPATGRNHGS